MENECNIYKILERIANIIKAQGDSSEKIFTNQVDLINKQVDIINRQVDIIEKQRQDNFTLAEKLINSLKDK